LRRIADNQEENEYGSDDDQDEANDDFRMDLALSKSISLAKHIQTPHQDRTGSVRSESGWSDDDSDTIKSEFTHESYGTIGSAVVVDATIGSREKATEYRSKVAALKQAQQKAAASTTQSQEMHMSQNQQKQNDVDDELKTGTTLKKKKKKKRASSGTKKKNKRKK